MEVHNTYTERDPFTHMKTGNYPTADAHITVYFGPSKDWIQVHGHLYTIQDEDTDTPVGLTPINDLSKHDDGRAVRNPELWEWTSPKPRDKWTVPTALRGYKDPARLKEINRRTDWRRPTTDVLKVPRH